MPTRRCTGPWVGDNSSDRVRQVFILSLWYFPSHFGLHVDDVARAFSTAGYDVTIVTVSDDVFELPYFDPFRDFFGVARGEWHNVIRLNINDFKERGVNNPAIAIARDSVFEWCMQQIAAGPCCLLHFFEMLLPYFNSDTVRTAKVTSVMYAGNFISRITSQRSNEPGRPISTEEIVSDFLNPYSIGLPDGAYRLRGVDCLLSETRNLPLMLQSTRLRTPAYWTSRPVFPEPVLAATPSDLHREFGFPLDAKVLLYAGRASKNAQVLPTVLRLVRQGVAGERAVLLLAGTCEEEVAAWPDMSIVRDHVKAVPFLPRGELFGVMKSADVFVYPGLVDGYPKVVSEANLARLPVVAFTADTSGLHEIMQDRATALMINVTSAQLPGDVELAQFATAITLLLTNTDLRENIVKQAFATAQEADGRRFVGRVERHWARHRRQQSGGAYD